MNEVNAARAIVPLLGTRRWLVAAIVVLGTLAALSEGVGISLIIPFLHSLAGPEAHASSRYAELLEHWLPPMAPGARIMVIPLLIFAAVVVKNALMLGNTVLLSWVTFDAAHRLRAGAFRQLLHVGLGYLDARDTGKLTNTLANEAWGAGQAVSTSLNLLVTSCTILVFVGLLLLISWPLTLVAAAAIVVVSATLHLANRRVAKLGTQAVGTNARLTDRIIEGLAGMRVIRAFGREDHEATRFSRVSDDVRRTFFRLDVSANGIRPIAEVCYAGVLLLILGVTLQRGMSVPTLLAFVFVLYRLQPHLKYLAAQRTDLGRHMSSVDALMSLVHLRDEQRAASGTMLFRGLAREIAFDRVNFTYPNAEAPALQDVTIRFARGKTTAIVGPSGAGKTTIINLLLRFHDPTTGDIRIDGVSLREFEIASWRARIAFASQDGHLFNGTVRENIAYGRLDAQPAEIAAAAEQANGHAFILGLPDGYDSRIGDRGVRLSAGQRQRIVLARAFLRADPDVLILDEGTNALDSLSEQHIQAAVRRLGGERTVIIVAHRLSTIEHADHIIVLEHGRVMEQGTFDALVRSKGLFARLAALQRTASD